MSQLVDFKLSGLNPNRAISEQRFTSLSVKRCVCERARDRDRETETERQRDREEREREREREGGRERALPIKSLVRIY
jgi:hypothetical protein